MIADEMAIGMVNQKTTAARLIPAVGKGVGDRVEFGGLFGYARKRGWPCRWQRKTKHRPRDNGGACQKGSQYLAQEIWNNK